MAISNTGLPSYSFAMFLAFASFGSYIWSSDPLQTARPQSINSPAVSSSSLTSISARLWQDPFRVIYARSKGDKKLDIQDVDGRQLKNDVAEYFDKETEEELLVLGVMVSTEAISDAEERRRRNRYALVSALSNAKFVPEDAGHIQVAGIPNSDAPDDPKILPYEWYKYETHITDGGKKVLLLWLDASHYANTPYVRFNQLIDVLADRGLHRKRLRLAIIGPAGSGGLRTLIKNSVVEKTNAVSLPVQYLHRSGIAGLHILSATATIADERLYAKDEPAEGYLENRFSLKHCNSTETCITFNRTIASDDRLMSELTQELKFRGIDDEHSHVVILSELDTSFGRALPVSFIDKFCEYDNDASQERCRKHIHRFSYLRGIDGVAPGSIADIGLSSSKSSVSKKANAPPSINETIRRPIGAGQFDYLRRIADEIVKKDKKFRKFNGKGIRAIGILGSDVYDKLLILHALRSRLMGVTFFTTDLDAQFLHPGEFDWTRNMVVASSFDLKLSNRLQGSTPPFRDSYQTSIFYSAGLALSVPKNDFETRANLPTSLRPLLFEVGRNGAVLLQPRDAINDHPPIAVDDEPILFPECSATQQCALHPFSDNQNIGQVFTLVIAILLLALLALGQLNARARYQMYWLASAVLVLMLVSAIGVWCSLNHEEPFIMLSGISVWPTEIMNSMIFILSLYFVCISKRALDKNYLEIGHRYLLFNRIDYATNEQGVPLSMSTISYHLPSVKNNWIFLVVIMLLVSAALVATLPLTITYEFIYLMLFIWGAVFAVWFGLIYLYVPVARINKWISNQQQQKIESLQQSKQIPVQRFWQTYGEYGSQRNRFLRACTVVLIFQAFISLVFTLFGLEAPPLRGPYTLAVDAVITVLSLLGMLFVLFYMVDATRLCIAWVKGLTENSYDWGDTGVDELVVELNIPRKYAIDWLKLHIIAERTREVGKLIFYPFIIIVLILFSRINYFDDWGFPQSMAIITSSLIAIALYAAIKLRQEAELVRATFMDKLNMDKLTVGGNKSLNDKPTLTQIDELIENVSQLRKGAFQPILEQPLVKASLLLLGGVGLSASQFTYLL